MGKILNNIRNRILKLNDKSVNLLEKLALGCIAIIITFLILSILASIVALFKINNKDMPVPSKVSGSESINILLLGMDIGDVSHPNEDSIKRTDTIMILNYNPKSGKMNIVSVPRDTLITVKNRSLKINSAYEIGGYPLIKTEVENLLNVNINYIVKINYEAFRAIVDAVGGVTMKIDRNMIYDDEAQNLHINFKAGDTVKLDGEKAEEFFRWRKNNDGSGLANGDLDRIENQQQFLKKLIDKLKSPLLLFRIPKIMLALGDYVDTNMPVNKIISYGSKFVWIRSSKINMMTIQGTPKTINRESYLVFDKDSNKEILTLLGSSGETLTNQSKDNVRIKILNGTKITGLAAELQQDLNKLGYTKIDTGNIEGIDSSEILTNNNAMLNLIKNDVKINKFDQKENKKEYNEYDVIIILGKDFKKFGS